MFKPFLRYHKGIAIRYLKRIKKSVQTLLSGLTEQQKRKRKKKDSLYIWHPFNFSITLKKQIRPIAFGCSIGTISRRRAT